MCRYVIRTRYLQMQYLQGILICVGNAEHATSLRGLEVAARHIPKRLGDCSTPHITMQYRMLELLCCPCVHFGMRLGGSGFYHPLSRPPPPQKKLEGTAKEGLRLGLTYITGRRT